MTPSEDFPYSLTSHGAAVLAEREIPLDWVARVLAQPARVEPDEDNSNLRHAVGRIPEFRGRVLRVIYDGTTSPWRIVTAFFDRRLRDTL